jgi:FdhD protein
MKTKQTDQQESTSTKMSSRGLRQVVYSQGKINAVPANVIVEFSVSITVNGEWWLSVLCTPIDMEAMAIGFLYNEGIIAELSEVASVRVCPQGDNIDIWLTHTAQKPQHWTRTSGCSGGLTGVALPPGDKMMFSNGGMLSPMQINDMLAEFYQIQVLYQQTGGVHTSALSDGQMIVVAAEDIGRHNTLDKLAGHCLMKQLTPARRILLTTGRISSEMLQKAIRLRAPIVISRTSPSSRSVEMAEGSGITLIGYARRDHFVVYTHPKRIIIEST